MAGRLSRFALALLMAPAFSTVAQAQGLGNGWLRDWMRDPRPASAPEKPAQKPAEKAAPSPIPDAAGAKPLPGNEELLANFSKIAFNVEGGDRMLHRRLMRWQVPVHVAMRGDAVAGAAAMVDGHLKQLRQLTGHDIARRDASAGGPAPNLIVLFATRVRDDVLGRYRGIGRHFFKSDGEMDETIRASSDRAVCYGVVRHGAAGIVSALVVVPSHAAPATRYQCIVEEISQAMGLFNDSESVLDSIFNDQSPYVDLTEQDKILLRVLYDRRLAAGMTEAEAEPMVRRILSELRPGG